MKRMSNQLFNLLDEPWIRVMDKDGAVEEKSIYDVLLHAQDYLRLAGETETQNLPVFRILEAILLAIYAKYDANGNFDPIEESEDASKRWGELWEHKHFEEKPLREYLETYRDRFWLRDDQYPFMQSIKAKDGTDYKTSKLIGELSESNNKVRLFQSRLGEGKEKLSCAEAARWLLFVNAFDDTSAKAKQKGLPSPGAGWLGQIGPIYAKGDNLYESLLLNLVFLNDDEVWNEIKPTWEMAPRYGERTKIVPPNNPATLYTTASRRLLLKWNGDKVVGYTSLGGDFFDKTDYFVEMNTAYRLDKKSKSASIYLPKKIDPSKQIWRDFKNLFVESSEDDHRIPGVIHWIRELQSDGRLSNDQKVTFETSSVQYGDKCFFINDLTGDSLTISTALLKDENEVWRIMVEKAVSLCEKMANEAGSCKYNIALAKGVSGDDILKKERAQGKIAFYDRVDIPMRIWMNQLDPNTQDQKEELENIKVEFKKGADDLINEWVGNSSVGALQGRMVKGRHYSLPESINWFMWHIHELLKGGEKNGK